MKPIEQILKENKNTYLWQDKATIDLVIVSDSKSFADDITSMKCEACGNLLITKNEDILNKIDVNVNGVQIECKSCKQKWFIHKPVAIPKAAPSKAN